MIKISDIFIHIVCEGAATEPNYLNGYLRSKGYKKPNPAYKPKDNSPLGIAKAAKEHYKQALEAKIPKKNIFIWAVFDRDEHSGIREAIEILLNTPIQVAFSNVCFEFWILLHFEYTTRSFHNCDEIIRHIRQNHDADYGKSNDHFARLSDLIPIAQKNATRLLTYWEYETRPYWELNPYSNVHQMIQKLGELLKT
jgi:hypothetical protein